MMRYILKYRWFILGAVLAALGIFCLRGRIEGIPVGLGGCGGCKPVPAATPQPVDPNKPVKNVKAAPRSLIDVVTGREHPELRNVSPEARRRGVARVVRVTVKVPDAVTREITRSAVSSTKSQIISAVATAVSSNTAKSSYTPEEVIAIVETVVKTLQVSIPTTTPTVATAEIVTTRGGEVFVSGNTVSSAVVVNFPDVFGVCFGPKVLAQASTAYPPYYVLPAVGAEVVYYQTFDQEGRKVTGRYTLDIVANWKAAGLGVSMRVWRGLNIGAGAVATYTLPVTFHPYLGLGISF